MRDALPCVIVRETAPLRGDVLPESLYVDALHLTSDGYIRLARALGH